jgi:hypothetical protein
MLSNRSFDEFHLNKKVKRGSPHHRFLIALLSLEKIAGPKTAIWNGGFSEADYMYTPQLAFIGRSRLLNTCSVRTTSSFPCLRLSSADPFSRQCPACFR